MKRLFKKFIAELDAAKRLPQRSQRSGLGSLGDRIRDYKGLGMGRRFPQMPMRQPTMQPMVPFPQERATVVRRGPEFQDRPLDIGFGWERPFLPVEPMPMPSLPPEEITQQRIDQVSQFEQEPMMGARYGDIGGYAFGGSATNLPEDINLREDLAEAMRRVAMEKASNIPSRQKPLNVAFGGSVTNLPDYTTRTSRYPSVDWETIRPEGGHPLRFADARFDPQRIGYADTGMRSDSDRPYALPGGYAGGGIADLISYYGR
jgi:hypothetical protein